jgi:uncharacterized glyoxalase superfamily protein PhnB
VTDLFHPADPLDTLRLPELPVACRPGFGEALRARLATALDLDPSLEPGGPAMTTTEPAPAHLPGTSPGIPSLIPYLAVNDARAAIRFYVDAFDAEPDGSAIVHSDGRIGHAQLRIRDAVVMLADPWDLPGVDHPLSRGATTVQLHLFVEDVDATYRQAIAAGGESVRPPEDQSYGDRSGGVRDPFGHVWMLSTAGPGLSDDELARTFEPEGFHLEDAGDLGEVDLGSRSPTPEDEGD